MIPRIFTSDPEVLAQCALLWPLFALMQPLNGAVFALDGILIGASDGAYLALSMVVAFVVFAVALAVVSLGGLGRAGRLGRADGAHRDAARADGRPLPAAAVARHGVRLTRAGRSQFARTATSANPARRMLRYEFEGRSSRRSPVSVTRTSQPDLARVADALGEQRALAALAAVLGQRRREAEVADAFRDEHARRRRRLVAVEREPAVPADLVRAGRPRRRSVRQAVAGGDDPAEGRPPRPGPTRTSRSEVGRRGHVLEPAPERHPAPARLEARARSASRRAPPAGRRDATAT